MELVMRSTFALQLATEEVAFFSRIINRAQQIFVVVETRLLLCAIKSRNKMELEYEQHLLCNL